MQSQPPQPPNRSPVAYATAPLRLVGDLGIALAYTAHELPHLVQDLRQLVNDLTRLASDADPGALSDLIAELTRAASRDGELTQLLDRAGELAAARAARERTELVEAQ